MSFRFRFTEWLTSRYPQEDVDAFLDEMQQVMEEQLEKQSVACEGIVCNDREIYVESGTILDACNYEVEELLFSLTDVMEKYGFTDTDVYYTASYYGIAVEHMDWDGTLSSEEPSSGLMLFELVDEQAVRPFLDSHAPLSAVHQSPDAARALNAFRKGGIQGADFQQEKSYFLGGLDPLCFYMALDRTEMEENISVSNWYDIEIYQILSEGEIPDFKYGPKWNRGYVLGSGNRWCFCSYKFLDEDLHDSLEKLYTIGDSDDTGKDRNVNWIQEYTEFSRVQVYNAGQALCVGIFGLFGSEKKTQERLAVFFDFGIPYVGNRPRPNAAPDYQKICNEIASFVNGSGGNRETRAHLHIVLSHWHLDHCILAECMSRELAHTIWHVPYEGLGPSAQRIRSHIVSNGGRVYPSVGPFDALHINENLVYGKIDYGFKRDPNPRVVRNSRHLHHHGMYLVVNLESGKKVLLSGDCTYAGINGSIRAHGFHCLQASHHGGNYALAPAVRNAADIPVPAAGALDVVYSCGPYSEQHHPSIASVQEHAQAGWTSYHATHTMGGYTIQ